MRQRVASPLSPALWALVLAALGQFFLAHPQQPLTLAAGLFLFGAALGLALPLFTAKPSPPAPLERKVEISCFLAILALAAFLRLFRLDSIPAGMHSDQGLMGLFADRIAFEGWRPFFEVFDYHVPEVTMYYLLAGWLKLFGSSYLTFHWFFAGTALAAFPLIYWTFRQLSGPRVALLALFLLAVMGWHLTFSRNGFPTIQVPLYLFGTLAFWLHWLKQRKPWALVVSALFCGLGLYTYQSFKAVPFLMAVLFFYEYRRAPAERPGLRLPLLTYFLLFEGVTAPLLWFMFQHHSWGIREGQVFIGQAVADQKSLWPLVKSVVDTLLMFNRSGDTNPLHDLPGRRMLDDLTGAFFILGLGHAFTRRKERDGFYALAGLGLMLLPGLLTIDAPHANRLLAATPFVAYLAARGGLSMVDNAKKIWGGSKAGTWAVGIVLLTAVTAQNVHGYFVDQANDPDAQQAAGPEANLLGRNLETLIKTLPPKQYYFLDPTYFENPTVQFLSFPRREQVKELNLQELCGDRLPKDKTAFFLFDPQKSGWAGFLRVLFPEMVELKKSDKGTFIYECVASKEALAKVRSWHKGLKGTYIGSGSWDAAPLITRQDPVLNFISPKDFPFNGPPPYRIRWTGTLEAPQSGPYQFQVLTTDKAKLWLDGKEVALEKDLALRTGTHKLRLEMEKNGGKVMALHLVWQRPGRAGWGVVPATAFGTYR